jgi:hypothetical protein
VWFILRHSQSDDWRINRGGYGRKTSWANPDIQSYDSRTLGQPAFRPRFLSGHLTISNPEHLHLSSLLRTPPLPPTFLLWSLREYSVALVVADFKRFVKINGAKRKLGKMHSLHRNMPIGILRRNLSKTGQQRGLYPVHDHDNLELWVHTKVWMRLPRPYQQWQTLFSSDSDNVSPDR